MTFLDEIKEWQQMHGLEPDGTVGPATWRQLQEAMGAVTTSFHYRAASPPFAALTTEQAKEKFGDPTGGQPLQGTTFHPDPKWYRDNVVPISMRAFPGAAKIPHFPGTVEVHRAFEPALVGFWGALYRAGMIDRGVIRSFDGTVAFRLVRGGDHLSMHAFGVAVDFNAAQNPLGGPPAELGQDGCLLELPYIAYEYGLYPGGYFHRQDWMHWQLSVIR